MECRLQLLVKRLYESLFDDLVAAQTHDIHLLLLVENGTKQALTFDVDYDSVSVNRYMTDFICYSRTAAPGGSGVLDVELLGSALEKNSITGLEDITEVELTVEARNDNYKTVARPVETVSVK